METIKKLTDKKFKGFVTGTILVIGLILDIILMSGTVSSTGKAVWSSARFWTGNADTVSAICMIFILQFCLCAASVVVGVILSFAGKKTYMWPFAALLGSHVLMLALNVSFNVLSLDILIILSAILAAIGLIYSFLCSFAEDRSGGKKVIYTRLKKTLVCLGAASMLLILILFYTPLCSYTVDDVAYSIAPMGVFSSGVNNIISLILFLFLFVFAVIGFIKLSGSLRSYASDEASFAEKIRSLVNMNTLITGAYFMAGLVICSLNNSTGGNHITYSFIPFLLMAAVAFACALCTRKVLTIEHGPQEKSYIAARIEFFVYGTLVAAITIASALSDIIVVDFGSVFIAPIRLNGYDIFMTYNSLASGLQLVAFLLFAILSVTITLFIASVISLVSRSKFFFRITLAELISGGIFSLMIGLFGKYYEIVQILNKDVIESLIESIDGYYYYTSFDFIVQSQSFYWFIAAMAVVAVALVRKPYSRGTIGETAYTIDGTYGGTASEYAPFADNSLPTAEPAVGESDPCPAFTELDRKAVGFKEEEIRKQASVFQSPTLPALVQFVVNYARDCRLHLSYTAEDIATFVAGLGATRLSILQGMSGTGKTSLPKIFAEAILGNCEIIEVESSWRDKNELLGYYNEFSKTYTPKKFTQALYKAKLNPETVTFIVLDEMNLSRIEYYFSDFLSLMENEEDKREIKLLNVPLSRTENGKRYAYSALHEGHTIKVPNNIWFIGTANRDESTFEISDKVYDRAHTMNFNKRAAKPLAYGDPIPQRYLTVETFAELLEKAKSSVRFDIDNYPLIREVEALLAPYNISFGNRIAKQIETFVSIYCSCFTAPEAVAFDAVEKILLSKVVSKLEFKSVENKTQLAAEFEKRKLHRCSEFILKLNED